MENGVRSRLLEAARNRTLPPVPAGWNESIDPCTEEVFYTNSVTGARVILFCHLPTCSVIYFLSSVFLILIESCVMLFPSPTISNSTRNELNEMNPVQWFRGMNRTSWNFGMNSRPRRFRNRNQTGLNWADRFKSVDRNGSQLAAVVLTVEMLSPQRPMISPPDLKRKEEIRNTSEKKRKRKETNGWLQRGRPEACSGFKINAGNYWNVGSS